MNIAQYFEDRGMQRGLEEGRQEGRQEERTKVIRELLASGLDLEELKSKLKITDEEIRLMAESKSA